MRSSFVFVLAAALLVPLASARAAEPPQIDLQSGAEQPAAPQDDQAAAAQQQQDSALNIIIIQAEDERFIPNPFKNPSPRLISDGWAQRT
jgi:hypothetical protein